MPFPNIDQIRMEIRLHMDLAAWKLGCVWILPHGNWAAYGFCRMEIRLHWDLATCRLEGMPH